jgi:1,4-dihydroxy-2-naphthoate octaprenyltransferase/chlorophyll synthase
VVGVGGFVTLGSGRLAPAALSAAAVACFAAYSLPPVRLNSRGGGELLEALGVGVLLPLAIASLLGPLPGHPGAVALLGGAFALALCSALLSGLCDEVSDRQGGKVTAVTALGPPAALRLALVALATAPATLLVAAAAGWLPWVVAPAALAPMGWLIGLPVREASVSMNLEAQGRLKRRVHRVISVLLLLSAAAAATLPRTDAPVAP